MKDPIFKRLLQLHPKFSDLSLGRIKKLLKAINFDERKLPYVIHIAGTNGKGSTASIIKSILNSHGYSTHVYTTPHLVNFNERIQLKSKNISNQLLLKYLRFCEKKNKGRLITFFEITTAAAFKAFQDHKADFLILEVGLGGRFDATNIITQAKHVAITPISIDHQDYLGNTLTKIAFEKLGVINKKSKIFINKQKTIVQNFIQSFLKKHKLQAAIFNADWKIQSNKYKSQNEIIELSNLSLKGKHQKFNAGLAIRICQDILGNQFNNELTQKALQNCIWPGRFQPILKGKLVRSISHFKDIHLDGFHNLDGMKTFISNLPSNKKILVCSFLNNKKYNQMLKKLSPHFKEIIVVQMNEENSITQKDLSSQLSVTFVSSLNKLFPALNQISTQDTSLYFGGSLYFIGEVLKYNQSR